MTVRNNGPSVATGVILSDAIPSVLGSVTATPSQGSACLVSQVRVICQLGTLAVNSTATVTVTGTATQVGTLVNAASVAGQRAGPEPR